ncbi:pentapeptide repeat-containing protein [Rothia mucilaginosa]|uniref:pentapeptide repeat-containing protein n=1 Tax=Rothia mucilaginosa TaxID=43675 RepID=UPI0026EF3C26|nr:pentapeptide repeat-containing protein [Rothia mucilaginosa]
MPPKNTSPAKQSSRQLEKKIIALFVIPAVVFAAISGREGLDDQQIADLAERFNFSKFGAPVNGAIITFLLLLFGLFAFFPLIRLIQKFFSALTGKYFVISLAALAVLGAVSALYIPSYTNWFKPDTQQSTSSTQNGQGSGNQQSQSSKDPSSDLRLHLLYITGGIIAVLGLIETNRKNSQDHIRQVHAARRDRYIEAVDKLSSEQAPVRLGGVYALFGLVDEWLDDDNVDEKVRTKEGQIIINNLCSYIRSPFSLAEKREILEGPANMHVYSGNLSDDKAKLREEQDVRRTIFEEMSKRSSDFTSKDRKIVKTFLDPWNKFDFDFTQAQIFYPLNNLTIEQGNFSYAIFYGQADFSGSSFIRDTAFNDVHFTQIANFNKVIFNGKADFSTQGNTKTVFVRKATFNGTLFIQGANFNEVTFNEVADFSAQGNTKTVFGGDTTFNGTQFTQKANFNEVAFSKVADFSTQGDTKTTFGGDTTFNGAHFTQEANFNEVTFNEAADFSGFTGKNTIFKEKTTFIGTHFSGKSFFNNISFEGVVDFSSKDPLYPATFSDQTEFLDTTFASKADFTSLVVDPSQNSSGLVFQKVLFKGKAIFESVQFSQIAEFKETEFQEGANFENAHFYCSAKFIEKTKFKQKANFLGSMFGQGLVINANFEHDAEFSFSRIGSLNGAPHKIVFQNSTFEKSADFCEAKFYDDVKFLDSRFRMEADFSNAEFYGEASFNRSYQHQTTSGHFLYSMFEKEATFYNTSFFGDADFQNMRFCGQANFTEAYFDKSINFTDTVFQGDLCCSGCTFSSLAPIFNNTKFEINTIRLFNLHPTSIKINLGQLSINHGNLTKIYILPVGSYLFSGNNPNSPVAGPAQ